MSNKRWCCTVCGYIHEGHTPPDFCVICGATADLFELSVLAPAPVKIEPVGWRCINCDYSYNGATPPGNCPLCGVGPDQFEAIEKQVLSSATNVIFMSGKIVIVGGGIAGLSAAESARLASPEASITLICQEKYLPYYRLNLTRYLADEITISDLPIHPESWYADHRITILNDTEVTAIDRAAKRVAVKGHADLCYDKLILAMGAHPSIPPIKGADKENVLTLRTCGDADKILRHCGTNARCAIIGGGVLGLEIAAALSRRNVWVTLVEGFDWLLPRQLNRTAGERLAKEAVALGIELVCGARIKELEGDEKVRGVVLDSGEAIPADLAIIAAGVRSNTYLARLAGLDVNLGVVVDQHLRTSDDDIYAAGDVAEHLGTVYGTWAPSQFQGKIAGMNAVGGEAVFSGIPRSNVIKVLGVDLFSIGQVHPDDASYLVFEEAGDNFKQFIFRDSHLVGAILFGNTSLVSSVKKLIEEKISCVELLSGANDAIGIYAGIETMF